MQGHIKLFSERIMILDINQGFIGAKSLIFLRQFKDIITNGRMSVCIKGREMIPEGINISNFEVY